MASARESAESLASRGTAKGRARLRGEERLSVWDGALVKWHDDEHIMSEQMVIGKLVIVFIITSVFHFVWFGFDQKRLSGFVLAW